jgi:hypothetical protein
MGRSQETGVRRQNGRLRSEKEESGDRKQNKNRCRRHRTFIAHEPMHCSTPSGSQVFGLGFAINVLSRRDNITGEMLKCGQGTEWKAEIRE